MKQEQIYSLREQLNQHDYLVASYYIELSPDVDPYEKAKTFAVGQTIGTWVPVPGITDEMRDRYMGKVIQVFDIPPADLTVQPVGNEKRPYLFQIAYPTHNFGPDFPMLITTLLGNDASTSAQAKLVDICMPKPFLNAFPGPSFGIEGLRNLTGVYDRPLLLNMIKPCTGFTAEVGQKIFYETALGGVDFIKDDELLGNPTFCPLVQRVKAYNAASDAAYEKTGKRTIYVANITAGVGRLEENAKRAVDAGARMLMVNFAAVGYSALQRITELVNVPILGHYAGSGPYYEGTYTGISSPLAVGRFPRMAGADVVMINTPYGGYPLKRQKYLRTFHELSMPLGNVKRSLTSVGGGVRPGLVRRFIDDLGADIMLSPGGAIQGHPMGPAAGVRAMFQAIEAAMQQISVEEMAKEHQELRIALDMWG